MQTKKVTLPKLNNLSPTLESTALKLMEEAGELAQAIGKLRGMSGEASRLDEKQVMQVISRELLDVAQTAVSMMFVLEEQYGVDIDALHQEHVEKLKRKGYIVDTQAAGGTTREIKAAGEK
ncbi:NTP pyrophosphatase (non-canonical NTP hydrolase) [Desulfohalotomaculum tongense]|uniref:MazG-like family protein n=1 Tax=Desulforadius tongensis TaxID=1216062 RepID=UPI0019582750|nr:MazG-like family protein [Desulforadius tongensis]MBM7853740.1 NTP pyrophosphatase (non-canonical NTP hydrolase) [Desulforadius tongensis]